MYDVKAEFFGPLFECRTDEEAIRVVLTSISRSTESNLARFTDDFSLYKLGDFNASNGQLLACAPELIISGFEIKQQYIKLLNSIYQGGTNDDSRQDTDDIENIESVG